MSDSQRAAADRTGAADLVATVLARHGCLDSLAVALEAVDELHAAGWRRTNATKAAAASRPQRPQTDPPPDWRAARQALGHHPTTGLDQQL